MRFILIGILIINSLFSAQAQKLVLPGDYPDPSVVKIGDTYWASATTSDWFPAYPLLHSKDLINWESSGYIFNQKPSWVDRYFWAPEITYDNGRVYVYYSAHKEGGNLCVGVASADKPEGPYKDHGTLICQTDGSIDAFPMRDESGKLYLIWKEDGNSVKLPTPIWIQEMNEDRTALLGEKKELFRNDSPWESNLVEGVSMIKRGEYYYAIYAAAGCCGPGCTYNTGVARSKSLMGPWEKDPRNPVLTSTSEWKCPGHGTAVEKDGKFYFLYHAYNTKGDVFIGRQGLLSEFKFDPDGWINFVKQPEEGAKVQSIEDRFEDTKLTDNWQWSVFQNINKKIRNGNFELQALPTNTGAFMGQKILTRNYEVTIDLIRKKTSATAGLGILGDNKNNIFVAVEKDSLKIISVRGDKETIITKEKISKSKRVSLKATVEEGYLIKFSYKSSESNFKTINQTPIDGSFLPPWDRGLRVGPVARGLRIQNATFDNFRINY